MNRIILFLMLIVPLYGQTCTTSGAFTYANSITINSSQVTATQTNFTATFFLNDATLKTVANSGKMQSSSAFDLCFFSDFGVTPLAGWAYDGPYSATAGTVVVKALIGSLSSSVNTKIYYFWGNASITTFQGGAGTAAYDTNTKFMWYGTSQNGSTTDLTDVTGNVTGATNHGTTYTSTGYNASNTAGATVFTRASTNYIDFGTPVALQVTNNLTLSWWTNVTGTASSNPECNCQYLQASNVGIGTPITTTPSFQFAYGNGTSNQTLVETATVTANTWYWMVETFASGVVKFYQNGVSLGSQTGTNTTIGYNGTQHMFMGSNSTPSVYMDGKLSDYRFDNVVRPLTWVQTTYNNMSSPSTFYTLGTPGPAELFTVSYNTAYFPTNYTGNLTITGTFTNWTSGTTFTTTVGTVNSKVVNSTTSVTLNITTTNTTGLMVISDGLVSENGPIVASPGLTATFGGPIRYVLPNSATNTSNGDTWLLMDTVNGLRTQCNDCTGISSSNNSNLAFFNETSDLKTITLNNGLTGFGTSQQQGLGQCSGRSIKGLGLATYNGWYLDNIVCQAPGAPFVDTLGTIALSTSGDDGAHWARVQDNYAVSAGSWTSGTATLTTAAQTLASTNLVAVSGCNPSTYNTLPNFVALSAASSTSVSYPITGNPGTYVSGCVVVGPAVAAATPPTTSMWTSGRCVRRQYAQVCLDNVSCTNNPDGSNYLVGMCVSGVAAAPDPVPFRILKTDFDLTPGDATKYQYWTGGTSWSSTLASGINPQCVSGNVSSACSSFGMGIIYIADTNLPDGGQYFMLNGTVVTTTIDVGVWSPIAIYHASHIYGPWFVAGVLYMDTNKTPSIGYNFHTTAISQYSVVSTTPYVARMCFQFGGNFQTADYGVYHDCALITLKATSESGLFNSVSSGVAGYGAKFHHIQNGLQALWRMASHGNNTVLKDDSVNGSNVALSAANAAPLEAMLSVDGLRNTDSSLNASWHNSGGAWNVPTGFTQNLGDFTVLLVAKSTLAATQTAIGGSQSAGNGFMFKATNTPTMSFIIELGGGGATTVTCPAPVASTYFGYIAGRIGSTAFCFKSGTSAPVTTSGSSTTLGASWNLYIGSESDGTPNYWTGTIGEIGIWNRGLCSYQLVSLGISACSAGQVDEVLAEFNAVHLESVLGNRGWGL